MLSCDTLVALSDFTAGRQNLFGKNSDRPMGEAQPLAVFPARDYEHGTPLSCTYITIPQTEHTYALIGSKPYWIWGMEIGVNEKGVVIGNEAEGSKVPLEAAAGLLGMDLLRLGLERGATAQEAMHVIIDLLEQYGQTANGHRTDGYYYDNSYLIADAAGAWLLETAGRQWVARRVRGYAAISNCYSIGADFDEASAEAEGQARANLWLSTQERFDFAKAYTSHALRQQRSVPRRRRLLKLLEPWQGLLDVAAVKMILRDHFEGELIEPRYGPGDGLFASICMHAMTGTDSKTAASLIASFDGTLGVVCRHCFSTPCSSVYMPVYLTGYLPAVLQNAGEVYEPESLWWALERLSCAIEVDSARFLPLVRPALTSLENEFEQQAAAVEQEAAALTRAGNRRMADDLLNALMDSCAARLLQAANSAGADLADILRSDGGVYGVKADLLQSYCARTGITLI